VRAFDENSLSREDSTEVFLAHDPVDLFLSKLCATEKRPCSTLPMCGFAKQRLFTGEAHFEAVPRTLRSGTKDLGGRRAAARGRADPAPAVAGFGAEDPRSSIAGTLSVRLLFLLQEFTPGRMAPARTRRGAAESATVDTNPESRWQTDAAGMASTWGMACTILTSAVARTGGERKSSETMPIRALRNGLNYRWAT